ncbi:hypothetical protein CPB86DRAFT_626349 [Serendipita vermifera]|nr:hypothetical protein CPB86DRAFT_626349 [Serendipita vermifera]
MSTMPKEERQKSRRGTGASCRECRRLKVRCDREVPCGSCVRRGCSGICPDGQLSAVKSARYVLASTEELHQRIQRLIFRVHELEHALEIANEKLEPGTTHPMLEHQLKKIARDPREPDTDDEEGMQGVTAGANGDAAPTSMLPSTSALGGSFEPSQIELPTLLPLDILQVDPSVQWQIPSQTSHPVATFPLPSKEEAWSLIDAYYENGATIYQPVPRSQALSVILIPAYTQNISILSLYDQSKMYSLLALGAFYDLKKPAFSPQAMGWLCTARDLLLSTVDSWETSVSSVEALSLLVFGYLSAKDVDIGKAYHLLGLPLRCAITAGLHKDPEVGTVSADELTRRRRAFWELWSLECIMALNLDRPPAIVKAFIESEMPIEEAERRSRESIYFQWKYNLAVISQEISTMLLPSSSNVPYSTVMVLDHRIRATRPTSLPQDVESTLVEGAVEIGMLDIVRTTSMDTLCQSTLIFLHRSHFAWAIMKDDMNPMAGKVAPSVLACYNGARDILNSAFTLLQEQPLLLPRLGYLWDKMLTSTIILYIIAIFMPYWQNVSEAITLADNSLTNLFERWSDIGKFQRVTPMLKNLKGMAVSALQRQAQGVWTHPSRIQTVPVPAAGVGSSRQPSPRGSQIFTSSTPDTIGTLFGGRSGGLQSAELYGGSVMPVSATQTASFVRTQPGNFSFLPILETVRLSYL